MIGTLGLILTPDEARRVTLPAMREYLTRSGWERVPSDRPGERYVTSAPIAGKKRGAVQLPVSESAFDYPVRVLDFIEFVSRLSDARPLALYAELTASAVPVSA